MADASSVAEVQTLMREYVEAFVSGTRNDLQAFVRLPIAYITDAEVQLRDRYPFDPVKMRAMTGIARTDVDVQVVHADRHKAHVIIEGVRKRADGSAVEGIEAFYILHRHESAWKITAISGIRLPMDEA